MTTPQPEHHITGMNDPFINWRCAKDNNLRCPGEGCSKADGCARDNGWTDSPSADLKGRWFEEHRQDWIAEVVSIFGFINRTHIQRKFGISTAQASLDLQTYQRRNPDAVSYNKTTKRYETTESLIIIDGTEP